MILIVVLAHHPPYSTLLLGARKDRQDLCRGRRSASESLDCVSSAHVEVIRRRAWRPRSLVVCRRDQSEGKYQLRLR